MKHPVFIISDGTGITAEHLGNSLLSQFDNIEFEKWVYPYIDTVQKAERLVETINDAQKTTGLNPLLFMTLINTEIVKVIKQSKASFFDLFNTFLGPLETALQAKSSFTVGRTHGFSDQEAYNQRLDALDYALIHDDGLKIRGYEKADIILIGVSRCGKTPSCLYMALQFHILAANYPITDEDLENDTLPTCLIPYREKLFGLTINPVRLQHIRTERRPDSTYASLRQCQFEINHVEKIYKKEQIPYLDSSHFSVEEIATKILSTVGITRRI